MKTLASVIFFLLMAPSAFALENCNASYITNPHNPDLIEWGPARLAHVSEAKIKGCPLSVMIDENSVYPLISMNLKECRYAIGKFEVHCDR